MGVFLPPLQLIVKAAGKNLGLALMDVDWYHKEALKHPDESIDYCAVRHNHVVYSKIDLQEMLLNDLAQNIGMIISP